MKKKFNNEHTLKSSEDCKKYSKSVSYETLVGGTPATGREYKQTRRLFLRSAVKPLSAVGTLTSLLCNSAKVVENLLRYVITRRTLVRRGYLPEQGTHANKESLFASVTWLMRLPRRIQRMLLVMTIPALTIFFTIAIITESRAECKYPRSNGTCKTLEEKGTCGEGCSYIYDSAMQTVYITATGDNAKIASDAFHDYYYENNSMPAQTFVINGAISISSNAFSELQRKLISGANEVLTLNGLGHHAFGNTTLSGTIIIPEGAEFGSIAFHGVTLAEDAKIYCGVENCKQKMIDSCNAFGNDDYGYITNCLNAVNNMGAKLLAYPNGCTKMGASGCTKCKNENFKLNEGECDRLRWTPAEAAKVLTDDNNNSVTITFKK